MLGPPSTGRTDVAYCEVVSGFWFRFDSRGLCEAIVTYGLERESELDLAYRYLFDFSGVKGRDGRIHTCIISGNYMWVTAVFLSGPITPLAGVDFPGLRKAVLEDFAEPFCRFM